MKIVKVAKAETFRRTNINTGWGHTFSEPVNTKSTFINITVGMRIPGIVRTGRYTGTATYANRAFNNDNSSLGKSACPGWAASDAR